MHCDCYLHWMKLKQERQEWCAQVLVRMRGTENVGAEWADIQAAVEEVKAHEVEFWKSLAVLFSPHYWKLALASVAIPFFQQFTGMVRVAHPVRACNLTCLLPLTGQLDQPFFTSHLKPRFLI